MIPLLTILPLLALPALAAPSSRTTGVGAPDSTVSWSLCPDTPNDARNTTFYCSSLKVPLNWIDPKDGVEADLYMRMYPAEEGVERKGSMLLESGGPGGSNTQWVLGVGSVFSTLTGGVYDIVGFDPRGVNLTYPNVRAHKSDYEADLFNTANPQIVLYNDPTVPFNASDPVAFKADLASFDAMDLRADLKARLVEQRTTEEERRSVSTAFGARDMAAVVDAIGEPDGLLTYYGVSYGTVLGVTFAAMFPDKVGRMVLDAVVNSQDYFNDWQKWLEAPAVASDEVSNEFCRLCARAGPERCALASPADSGLSPEQGTQAVATTVRSLVHQLYENPLPVLADADGLSSFVTAAELYAFYRATLYDPSSWQRVASAMQLGLQGNGTALRSLIPLPSSLVRGDKSLATDNVFNRTTENTDGNEVTQQIACADQGLAGWEQGLRNGTNEGWVEYAEKVRAKGWTTTEYLLNLIHGCRSYKEPAYERYAGPFDVKDGLRKLKNPILFVGNTHDPITPLDSARNMSLSFGEENASLLIHDARGHTTLVEPSLCTVSAIQGYLLNGTLPAYGTTCTADEELVFPVVSTQT